MLEYCSVLVSYANLIPSILNVHLRMDKMSHTLAYVGAICCGVGTPLKIILNILKKSRKNRKDRIQNILTRSSSHNVHKKWTNMDIVIEILMT